MHSVSAPGQGRIVGRDIELASLDQALEALDRGGSGAAVVVAEPGDQHDGAIAELTRAAADLEICGALRYRNEAARELGKLGHRVHRRTRAGKSNGSPIERLTGRELEVARLVVDHKTNAQIAAELFLSTKTVETHLRNILHKIRISTRLELAGVVEPADNGITRPN